MDSIIHLFILLPSTAILSFHLSFRLNQNSSTSMGEGRLGKEVRQSLTFARRGGYLRRGAMKRKYRKKR